MNFDVEYTQNHHLRKRRTKQNKREQEIQQQCEEEGKIKIGFSVRHPQLIFRLLFCL